MTQNKDELRDNGEVEAIMMNVRGDLICYIEREKTIPTIHRLKNVAGINVGVMGDGVLILKLNTSTHELNKLLTPIVGKFSIKDSRRGFSRFQVKDLIGTIKDIVKDYKND